MKVDLFPLDGAVRTFTHIDLVVSREAVAKTHDDGTAIGTRMLIYEPLHVVAILCSDDDAEPGA